MSHLVVFVVALVLVVLEGSPVVLPAPPLLRSATPTHRGPLLVVVEEDQGSSAAGVPRGLLLLVCKRTRGQRPSSPQAVDTPGEERLELRCSH